MLAWLAPVDKVSLYFDRISRKWILVAKMMDDWGIIHSLQISYDEHPSADERKEDTEFLVNKLTQAVFLASAKTYE